MQPVSVTFHDMALLIMVPFGVRNLTMFDAGGQKLAVTSGPA
jgi:hypothetical protein